MKLADIVHSRDISN